MEQVSHRPTSLRPKLEQNWGEAALKVLVKFFLNRGCFQLFLVSLMEAFQAVSGSDHQPSIQFRSFENHLKYLLTEKFKGSAVQEEELTAKDAHPVFCHLTRAGFNQICQNIFLSTLVVRTGLWKRRSLLVRGKPRWQVQVKLTS